MIRILRNCYQATVHTPQYWGFMKYHRQLIMMSKTCQRDHVLLNIISYDFLLYMQVCATLSIYTDAVNKFQVRLNKIT